jgi:Flp pilus assembly pilin Flp
LNRFGDGNPHPPLVSYEGEHEGQDYVEDHHHGHASRLGREDEKGASAVEYAILVGAVGAAVVLAVAGYTESALGTLFSNIIKSTW